MTLAANQWPFSFGLSGSARPQDCVPVLCRWPTASCLTEEFTAIGKVQSRR